MADRLHFHFERHSHNTFGVYVATKFLLLNAVKDVKTKPFIDADYNNDVIDAWVF
jgi:hypothetical protein